MTETTPYGIKETRAGFEVWQLWHGRKVSGPFKTREGAEAEAEALARLDR